MGVHGRQSPSICTPQFPGCRIREPSASFEFSNWVLECAKDPKFAIGVYVPRTLIDSCRLSQLHLPRLPKHSTLSHVAIDPNLAVSRDMVEEALLGYHARRKSKPSRSLSGGY